ncbi:MAG: hypothetical protein ACK5MR_17135 [Cumulibacter sp.]
MTNWEPIIAAVTDALNGDKDSGRQQLTTCWDTTNDDDQAQRCVIAHYLADLQDDLAYEVAWDERALAAHPYVSNADLAPVGIADAAALAPSLHLNLGDGYLRQERFEDAERQLQLGLARVHTLADDGYGQLIRGGLDRLAERLSARTAAANPALGRD